jgi:hypothetical protein
MLKVFCPFIWVASTFMNSFIYVARTLKNSFWGETVQLLPMFKEICPFIWVESTFKNSFWEKPYSCSQCSKSFSRSDKLKLHINQCCGSRMRVFSLPDPGLRIYMNEFKYCNPKKWFLSSYKYDPGSISRI